VIWTVTFDARKGTFGRVCGLCARHMLDGMGTALIARLAVASRSDPDDHTTFDADALPQVISGLRAQGYRFVTLDALTG